MMMVMAFAQTKQRIDEYVKDKLWYWHLPLWLFGLYIFVMLLGFDLTKPLPFVVQIPHAFDFMLHEVSHIVTGWLPALLTAAAGSGSELLLGALFVWGAFRFGNYFATLFCCLWLMLACMSVGAYMADAVPQQIPLVSLGAALSGSDAATHDWHFIFGQLGMLGASGFIGGAFKVVGILVGLFGLSFSAWVMYKMGAAADARPAMTKEDLAQLKASVNSKEAPTKAVYPTPLKGALAEHGPSKPSKDASGR